MTATVLNFSPFAHEISSVEAPKGGKFTEDSCIHILFLQLPSHITRQPDQVKSCNSKQLVLYNSAYWFTQCVNIERFAECDFLNCEALLWLADWDSFQPGEGEGPIRPFSVIVKSSWTFVWLKLQLAHSDRRRGLRADVGDPRAKIFLKHVPNIF